MIQPYLTAVDTDGETSILCTPDETGSLTYSHAIRKDALLTGPHTGEPTGEYSETISPRTPSPAELALAAATLALVPGGPSRLLYARVDMIPGPDGSPLLVELELAEPGLFFREAPGCWSVHRDGFRRRPGSARCPAVFFTSGGMWIRRCGCEESSE
jgi:hypothetical protein